MRVNAEPRFGLLPIRWAESALAELFRLEIAPLGRDSIRTLRERQARVLLFPVIVWGVDELLRLRIRRAVEHYEPALP